MKKESPQVISSGRWNDNVSWEFIIDSEVPELQLCTAVCCITTFEGNLLLIKNKRGWELPAGHIEENETILQAAEREVKEEAGVVISSPQIFGYKKLTALHPVPRRENPLTHYPFPYSYVVFMYAEALGLDEGSRGNDVSGMEKISYKEAINLFSDPSQYKDILDYLIVHQLINLNKS